MRFIVITLCVLFATRLQAQTDIDSLPRHWSAGFNVPRVQANYQAYDPASVAYIQYRAGKYALRLMFSSANYFDNMRTRTDYPTSIHLTDTTLAFGSSFKQRTGGGLSFEYLRYAPSRYPDFIELYGGAGIYGGMINNEEGTTFARYRLDSTGVFRQTTDSIALDLKRTYNNIQVGLVPSVGLLFWPQSLFSIGAELRLPFSYDWNKNVSTLSFEMQWTLHAIVNFRFKKSSSSDGIPEN